MEVLKKDLEVLQLFAKKVRLKRHELELTQAELAERANLDISYINKLENAKNNPSLLCMLKLAQALEISLKDLLPPNS